MRKAQRKINFDQERGNERWMEKLRKKVRGGLKCRKRPRLQSKCWDRRETPRKGGWQIDSLVTETGKDERCKRIGSDDKRKWRCE